MLSGRNGIAGGGGNGAPAPGGGNEEGAVMLASALEALQSNADGQTASIFVQLLSDNHPNGPQLSRVQRRHLISTAADRLGQESLSRTLQQAIPSVRLHSSKTAGSLLADLGSSGTSNEATVRALLERFGMSNANPPSDDTLQQILIDLLCVSGENTISDDPIVRVDILCKALWSFGKALSWPRVIQSLDEPEDLMFPLDARWDTLGRLMTLNPASGPWQTESVFWMNWAHPQRQLQILDGLTSLSEETFSFSMFPCRRIVVAMEYTDASPTVAQSAHEVQGSTWNAADLIETLVHLTEVDDANVRTMVTMLVDKAIKVNAELVLIALFRMSAPWSTVHQELVSKLFSMFLAGHTNHQLAFYCMWKSDAASMLNHVRSAYSDNAMIVSRILDVAQELRILDSVLDVQSFFFIMDVASLAARRELLNLDKWLQENIDRHGSDFVRAALEFVDAKVKEDLSKQDPQAEHTTVPLTVHTVATFLRVLRSNGDNMSAEEIDFFKAVRNLCLQLHPRLMNLAPGSESQEPGLQVVTFPQDIHKEVDGYYRQMYEEQISIDDLIALLQKLKASEDRHDRQVFACMVHTLFDEYRCFEMYYPARELVMTAVVFGSLIQHQLIDYIPLGIAIRYVLDALRNSPESNMFKFGLQALLCFQDRLPEWPQLGQALMSLPNVQQSHPEISRIIRAAANGQAPSNGAGPINGLLTGVSEEQIPFTAISVDAPRVDANSEKPDEQTSDKILFIVNNLSPSNLSDKLIEARRLIKPQLHQWLSSYLVLQRVSIEPNNHTLYTDFIDGLEAQPLIQHILHETLTKVKLLLNSDKTVQSTTERTILKNLGSWLGNLTLARNKPIRHRNIAFKELLIEGYDNNRLIVAIPFVCKVLEQCARSTIFKPPNPWLMAVLRLLVELYQFAELKLNLKFEIEVLCKSLNIDLKEIQCTTILRNRPQELAAQQAAQQAQQEAAQQRQLQALQPSPQQTQQHLLQQMSAAGGAGAGMAGVTQDMERMSMNRQPDNMNATLTAMLQSLPAYVHFNPGLVSFANNGALKRMIFAAIERAIREIINPVVERSVTIAAISTRELITKDFAMESDENKMRKSAHQMAQNLAGSLALVTCKEPLRISMVTHARTLFLQNGFTEQTVPEQAIVVIMQENLDLACSVVERAAMEKSLQEVDDGLSNAYMARRDHRVRGRGFYWDANALSQSQYASTLPDLLKLKPDGLQPQQVRVYEEFGKLPRAVGDLTDRNAGSPSMAHMPDAILPYPSGAGGEGEGREVQQQQQSQQQHHQQQQQLQQQQQHQQQILHQRQQQQRQAGDLAQVPLDGSLLNPQQSMERFTQCINSLERVLQQEDANAQITDEIWGLVRQVSVLALQSVNRDETTLVFAQKVVQLLYKCETDMARDVFIHLLERLCEVSMKAANEVTAWLVYAEDERKFNVAVTVGLVRSGLVNISEQDAQLAKFMQSRDFKPSIVDFSAKFAFACLKEPACATRQQLGNIIETLMRAHQRHQSTQEADDFLSELQIGNLQSKTDVESSQPLREQLAFCFAEWIRLFQHSPNAEKSFIDFITQLQGQGILKGEEISSMFFRVCAEVGVDSYIKHKAVGGSPATGIFQPIDAFSKLIVLMIKYHADPTGTNNEQAKVHYLTKILSIVVLVLAQSHEELGQHFQPKPFFRLFSSLLHDLHYAESNLQSTYLQTLLAISNTLNTLQPIFFPSFTFSWMSLISHRLFMPKLLAAQQDEAARQDGWNAYYRLFASLLRFLSPYLRSTQLQDTSRVLYRGTVRIVLVLLHDHPDFLAAYAHSFNDVIPPQCVQLRNLILSSYKRSEFPEGLPDVFDARLSMTHIEQCRADPYMADDYTASLTHVEGGALKARLDELLASYASSSTSDRSVLQTLGNVIRREDEGYNVPLINAIVVHAGALTVQESDNILSGHAASDGGIAILQVLLQLDPEGKYLTANAICSQLRYPNRHTAYFSAALLHLYANEPSAREALLRVLLERIIVNRPHPWGLLVTMFELLKDRQTYPLPNDTPTEIIKLLEHIRISLGAGPALMMGGGEQGVNGDANGIRVPHQMHEIAA